MMAKPEKKNVASSAAREAMTAVRDLGHPATLPYKRDGATKLM